MQKLKMHSADIAQAKLGQLEKLFPGCVTEAADANGVPRKAIDFDLLRQELSALLVEGAQERYQIDWPGKRRALLAANAPVARTLRPVRAESVDFDGTGNLYIEGDNLDALKLLQETYLGAIGLIYIDPPYNTGKDFLYRDDFAQDRASYLLQSAQRGEHGERYVSNPESNGRFHSDWLSMMYARLRLSRNLLDEHGVIFASINDREVHNLRKLLDEVFGASNFIACLIWDKNHSAQAGVFKAYHEYVLVYAKDIGQVDTPSSADGDLFEAGAMKRESARHPMTEFTFPPGVRFNAPDGTVLAGAWGGIERVELVSGSMVCENGRTRDEVTLRAAFTQKSQMQQFFYGDRDSLVDSRGQKIVEFYFTASGKIKIVKARGVETPPTTLKDYGSQGVISTELAALFGMDQSPIDSPKPVAMIKDFIRWFAGPDDIVLDFFSGSATTAHAVMELNAQTGSRRRFIMVQLPEPCGKGSAAARAGYATIAELGKDRIRKAGARIAEGDTGFRVLKVDSSNVADVHYRPGELTQDMLAGLVDNIRPGRSPEDLLFQAMLDCGIDLASPIERRTVGGKDVWFVAGGQLAACFVADASVDEAFVKELAQVRPARMVFRDAGWRDGAARAGASQIVAALSPATEVKCI